MDTESLKTFVTLAEYRNFSRTADALFIAQSTVTNRIAELEREVGRQLFARNKRRVTLTGEGEIYLTYARRMLELSQAGIQAMHTGTRYKGSLRLGTTNTIYECHLLPWIQSYREAYPRKAMKITIGHSNELIRQLQDELLDVVYVYLPVHKSGYRCELFAVDELVLVTRSGNPRYQQGILKEELAHADYLYCDFALQEVGMFIRELFPPYYQFGFEIDNSTKLIPYLLTCDGVSFLPERIALPYMEKGELRRIPLRDFQAPKINCYKIYRQGNEEAAAIG